MADSGTQVSKAAKKNKKKKLKKASKVTTKHGEEVSLQEVLDLLKEELVKAKENKDHKKAGTLRDQIWVLTDMVNGVRTDLPDDELEAILVNIPMPSTPPEDTQPPIAPPTSPSSGATNHIADDKEMKKLVKKLEQIQKLKERQEAGEKLEKNQLEKLHTEDRVKAEIAELEKLISEALQIR